MSKGQKWLGFHLWFSSMATLSCAAPELQRMTSVPGYAGRANDIIYSRMTSSTTGYREPKSSKIVFFGGDVQDYPELMQAHRDNHKHVKWNLEAVALSLANMFPGSEVLSNQTGVPTYSSDWGAHKHLTELMRNVHAKAVGVIGPETSNRGSTAECPANNKASGQGATNSSQNRDLTLIGFSKGCVVLNQILHEMKYSALEPGMQEFSARLRAMYWLDGGHSGGANTWVTDPKLLETLANSEIQIFVHVTPYQIQDQQRPWIRREEKMFTETLRKLKANVTRTVHFADREPSIELHFQILNDFHH